MRLLAGVAQPDIGLALRLSRDEHGSRLFLAPAERDARACADADARIRELEAELARRRS
jgi:hypothetical protein